jgi:hypothetical protein
VLEKMAKIAKFVNQKKIKQDEATFYTAVYVGADVPFGAGFDAQKAPEEGFVGLLGREE